MNAEAKYEAAQEAAVEYFMAAGYTYDEASGKLTAAPEGASLEYEVIIPADGEGDHPSFKLLTEAKEAFDNIGLNLIINDPSNSNILWDTLDAGTQELWCAAWGASIDPDMYQVYHSSNIIGLPGATEDNHYHIADPDLDDLIMEARTSDDQDFRKQTYKAALDIIIDWAVEIPIYQRQDATVFSAERVNLETVTPDITTFWGWMNDIELLQMIED
jgi:peptide/nickel transport system substrate-binding protein